MQIDIHNIYNNIISDFGGLWKFFPRGNSFEIITPYVTANNCFISVFLTAQNNNFILTDGGWINKGLYEIYPDDSDIILKKVLEYLKSSYDILEIEGEGYTYFYTKANNVIDISSKIFSLTSFILNFLNTASIDFKSNEEEDKKVTEMFRSQANKYIKTIADKNKIKFNHFISENKREIKFDVIYNNTPSTMTLINYISGSTSQNFSSSIFKTNTLFEMVENTEFSKYILNKLSIIDTNAQGYVPQKLDSFLNHLKGNTNSKIINWNEKEILRNYLS